MTRFSELAGLFVAVAMFLGTLIVAQSLVSPDGSDRRAELAGAID